VFIAAVAVAALLLMPAAARARFFLFSSTVFSLSS